MITYRKAEQKDIDGMFGIINDYAKKGIMLPRSKEMLQAQLANFVVAEDETGIIGCGSLCKLGNELVEIRSLGILEAYKGKGIGQNIVFLLEEEAKILSFSKLMALTYEVRFFEKQGFEVVPMHVLPEKVWTDCVSCKKQYCCDEIAVLKVL